MQTVNVHEAKTHFSRLLARAEAGEEIVLARAGKPVAKVVPYDANPAKPGKRKLGWLKGQFTVPDDFDTMFQKEIEEMFYGSDDKPA